MRQIRGNFLPRLVNSKINNKPVVENYLLKYIPLILTLAGLGLGFWQFNKNAEKEIRKEFYYKQVQHYEKIIDGVTSLMNNKTNRKDSLRNEFEKFKKLTEGSYLLFTTDTVNNQVRTFNYLFEHYYFSNDTYLSNDTSLSIIDIQRIIYKLINACRYSLNRTLGVELDIIKDQLK